MSISRMSQSRSSKAERGRAGDQKCVFHSVTIIVVTAERSLSEMVTQEKGRRGGVRRPFPRALLKTGNQGTEITRTTRYVLGLTT
jgi:hypothetical protein